MGTLEHRCCEKEENTKFAVNKIETAENDLQKQKNCCWKIEVC